MQPCGNPHRSSSCLRALFWLLRALSSACRLCSSARTSSSESPPCPGRSSESSSPWATSSSLMRASRERVWGTLEDERRRHRGRQREGHLKPSKNSSQRFRVLLRICNKNLNIPKSFFSNFRADVYMHKQKKNTNVYVNVTHSHQKSCCLCSVLNTGEKGSTNGKLT